MAWQNQYMELVATKPEIIRAEQDREISQDTLELFRTRVRDFAGCYVELGSGSGMHLLHLAQQSPDHLCVGLEIRFKRAFKTGEKAERRGLNNVMVFRTDAKQIANIFEPQSVSGFFVNYPDPWDKRRWLKNRLLNAELLATMHRCLTPNGFLRYKTDHHEYFASTCELFRPDSWEVKKHTTDLLGSPWVEGNIPTEFEQLFRSQGKPLCMAEVWKRGD
jgi:tRNA (guanine-N7-)-methyltransferase